MTWTTLYNTGAVVNDVYKIVPMNAEYNGGVSMRSGNNLVVPAGVTEVSLTFTCSNQAGGTTTADCYFSLYRNDSEEIQRTIIDNNVNMSASIVTGIIPVTPGDYFNVRMDNYGADMSFPANYGYKFSMRTLDALGFFRTNLLSDKVLTGSFALMNWAAPSIDTLGVWTGADNRFIPCPAGCSGAEVILNTKSVASDPVPSLWAVRADIDGIITVDYRDKQSHWCKSPSAFGCGPVTPPGNVYAYVAGDTSFTLDATYCTMEIAWLP